MNRVKWWIGVFGTLFVGLSSSFAWSKEVMHRAASVPTQYPAPEASDTSFVVKAGDSTSGNMGSIQGANITFYIPIGRYFGDTNLLLKNKALPTTVPLTMIVWDVDEADGEVDEIYVNDKKIEGGTFYGANEIWRKNVFQIPISVLNLPDTPRKTASNKISINISVGDPGHWVTQVNWASLDIAAPPPVVISHGIKDSAMGSSHILDSERGMKDLKDAVEALGLPVHTFSYDNHGFNSIAAGARELAREIDRVKTENRVDKVTILCHSMGGLKARHYTTEIDRNAESVDRVIQIATPNGGSDMLKRWLLLRSQPGIEALSLYVDFWLPALRQLEPRNMASYNSDHRLNRGVKYIVLAGKNDSYVSLSSAHTMVPAHPKSPEGGSRATHGGLVTAESYGGMVNTVIGSTLRQDLLERKHADDTWYSYGAIINLPPALEPTEEPDDLWTVGTGTVNLGTTSFAFPFQLSNGTGAGAFVSFVADEDIEVSTIRSPSGRVYSPADTGVQIDAFAGIMTIHIASAEPGTWTVSATRASGNTALSYAVAVQEEASDIRLGGEFVADSVRVGSSFVLEMTPTKAGDALAGLFGSAIVIFPDGTEQTNTLNQSQTGHYRATFKASQAGTYLVTAKVNISGVEYAQIFTCTAYESETKFGTLSADGPVDDDGDGFYDRLSVSGTLSGVEPVTAYRVFALLADQNGTNIAWAAATVTNGASTFRLDFDGTAIHEHGVATKYVVSTLRLSEQGEEYGAEIDARDGEVVFQGMSWSWNNFAHPLLTIPGTGTDSIISTSTTNAESALQVGMDLKYDASASGTYEYSVSLKSEDGALVGTAYGTVELNASSGISTKRLMLSFLGASIANTGINGPYHVTDLLLWNEVHDFAPEGEYETRPWAASDFGASGHWYVDAAKGNDNYFGSTWTIPKASIQAAINVAGAGDTIHVNDGLYAPISVPSGQNGLSIVSVNGAEKTVIDGALQRRCVTFSSSNQVMRGFTLQNGLAVANYDTYYHVSGGGALNGSFCECILQNNTADDGGGAYGAQLDRCIIEGNHANSGGGANNCVLTACVLQNNSATNEAHILYKVVPAVVRPYTTYGEKMAGGGSYACTLNNCLVNGNVAHVGGGVYGGTVLNSTIVNNQGAGCSGFLTYYFDGTASGGSVTISGTVKNSILVGNTFEGMKLPIVTNRVPLIEFSLADVELAGDGNIAANPKFVDEKHDVFRLRWDSPCVNTGTNDAVVTETDLDGNPRIFGGRVDIGAYEYRLSPNYGGRPLEWNSGGERGWKLVADEGFDVGYHIQSGAINTGTNSWVETVVQGQGIFSFDWRVSCNTRGHYAQFLVDGVQEGRISGETDWRHVEINVGSGEHVLRWNYVKGSTSAAGEDCACIANVIWRPRLTLVVASSAGSPTPGIGTHNHLYEDKVSARCTAEIQSGGVRQVCTGWLGTGSVPKTGKGAAVEFEMEEDSTLTWQWRKDYRIEVGMAGDAESDFETTWAEAGSTVIVSWTAPTPCYRTVALSGDTQGVEVNEKARILIIPADKPRSLTLDVSCITLGEALNVPQLEWNTGRDAAWFPQKEKSLDGDAAARSGAVLGDDESWLETTVQGPGTLSWAWFMEMSGTCGIEAFVDDVGIEGIDQGGEWRTCRVNVTGEGEHVVRFVFWNAGGSDNKGDFGLIDQVSWSGQYPPRQSVWYVDASTGNDENTGRSWTRAKATIQAAIDAAEDGARILVNDGVYDPISTVHWEYSDGAWHSVGKATEIVSVNGAERTVIDASLTAEDRCAFLGESDYYTGEPAGPQAILDGFTLRGARPDEVSSPLGAGAYGGILRRCIVTDNQTRAGGAGVAFATCEGCTISCNKTTLNGGGTFSCMLTDCVVEDNEAAENGGGAFAGRLERCVVRKNRSGRYGGGQSGGDAVDCLFAGNVSTLGGGGVNASHLSRCTVTGNHTDGTGGGAIRAVFHSSIVWGNTATQDDNCNTSQGAYNDTVPLLPGRGNISANPLFRDSATGDYRLNTGSPCIDAGFGPTDTGGKDILGNQRWQGARMDIGAYETVGSSAPAFTIVDLWVDAASGRDESSGTSREVPLATIQAAVEKASDGATIHVLPGTYEPFSLDSRTLTVQSTDGAEKTIVNGGGNAQCAWLGSDSKSVLVGLTLCNGYAFEEGGGVVGGTLSECIIRDNTADWGGGGACGAHLDRCILMDNSTRNGSGGGALACDLSNSLVYRNSAVYGGGIYGIGGGFHSVWNCTIADNTATEEGGGINSAFVKNSIVWNNSAPLGPDIWNSDEWHICASVVDSGCGSIMEDPLFVDAVAGDFRLRPDSPCVNAGANDYIQGETDLAGNVRKYGSAVDIGAYELLAGLIVNMEPQTINGRRACVLKIGEAKGSRYEIQWTDDLRGEWRSVKSWTADKDGENDVEVLPLQDGGTSFFRLVMPE